MGSFRGQWTAIVRHGKGCKIRPESDNVGGDGGVLEFFRFYVDVINA